MGNLNMRELSGSGKEFLKDPIMYAALTVIVASLDSTPEEYLFRFERALLDKEKELNEVFEKM